MEETKEAFGGPCDGEQLPVVPERMLAIPHGAQDHYALYEDVGLKYVFKEFTCAEPIEDEEVCS